ncbi:hypothetical protein GCM10008023_21300 [Sphingomonas glacialis]|uniref:Uncharacterized protein n=1 Tax=Sphingomonas glacialis TaxID=658225 RepID=A0ABQ3LI45_9SPHN|nr:hypothetical protein GCM10008023_21300 [Sphingomonas glacialis]
MGEPVAHSEVNAVLDEGVPTAHDFAFIAHVAGGKFMMHESVRALNDAITSVNNAVANVSFVEKILIFLIEPADLVQH